MSNERPDPPVTTSELRKDIDRGKTDDKVAYPDPAAAPLGTDAEAGGNPPRPAEIRTAGTRPTAPDVTPIPGHPDSGGPPASSVMRWVAWAAIAVVVLALLSFVIF